MKQTTIIGVDVSKKTLDIFVRPCNLHVQIENSIIGLKKWFKQLCSEIDITETFLLMEHTGSYSLRLEKFLLDQGVRFCKVPALQIKRSMGVARGKSDKVDAARIAEYGWLRRDSLVTEEPTSDDIRALQEYLSLRRKMVKDRAGYLTMIKESKSSDSLNKFSASMQKSIVRQLTTAIRKLEEEIMKLIKSSPDLNKNFLLLSSVKGVGFVVACQMICTTNNFKRFKNARKFNCYAGLAPFKYESGTSIRSKSRVSHLANKAMKMLLNMSAFCALRYDPELKVYYERRVNEGASKMKVVNIIRSKLVGRMFAIIKRQTPYQILDIAA